MEMDGLSGYNQRQNIEVIFNSEFGEQVGPASGRKRFNLDTELVANQNEIMLMSIKKAFIPFSFYCLEDTQKNNKISIIETKSSGATLSYTLQLPSGNYDINTLLSKLKILMEAQSTTASFNFKYTFTYDIDTNKTTIKLDSGTSATQSRFVFSADNSLCRIIGFSETDINVSVGNTITSDRVVDCADGLDGIRIKTDLPMSNVLSNGGKIGDDMLIIPIDTSPNGIIYFNETGVGFKHLLSTKQLKAIEINMTDRSGNTIHFNGIPYTLIMEVEFQFDIQKALVERANKINPRPEPTPPIDYKKMEDTNKSLLDIHFKKIEKMLNKK